MTHQLDGDYLRGCVKTPQGMKKLQNKFKDIGEFNLCSDPELEKFHQENGDYRWWHVCMAFGSGKLKIYVNGDVFSETSARGRVNHTPQEITIGAEAGTRQILNGRIFDFMMFDRCLDAHAVGSLMESGRAHCDVVDQRVKEREEEEEANKTEDNGDEDKMSA